MARRRILYALALMGCLVFYGAYQEWFSFILLQVIVYFPFLSLVLSFWAMLRIRMEPVAAPKIPMGSTEAIQLKVSSKYPLLPNKSKIRIVKPLTGERWILKPSDKLPTDHCGGLRAELHKPRVYDYLGLFGLPVRKTTAQTFLVLPEPVTMDVPPDLTRYLAQRWRPKPGGGYAENHEIRQFHPGDNLNQIHWKLSAKVGDLMLREPMEPERGLMLLTMDLRGTAAELDDKLGRLLWLGGWLLERRISFDIRVLTGNGIESWTVRDEWDLNKCIEDLLCSPFAPEGSIRDRGFTAAWRHHIGGEQGEA
jgi:uncharacterized protein (DUF58 family)